MISRTLYDIGLSLYRLGIRMKALSDKKARLWLTGRKNWEINTRKSLKNETRERIWMHCASLGEFEQGRPVFERIKESMPEYSFILTFFSPSGYEVRKDYRHADHIFYLPLDSSRNARIFIDILSPSIALFAKYEFWYHYLSHLQQKKIPTILFSAIFRRDQIFFRWYGKIFRQMLRKYSWIFVQDIKSKKLLSSLNIEKVEVAPDSRIDRVLEIADKALKLPLIEKFKGDQKLIVAGSTWAADLEVINNIELGNAKLVIAPHDISNENLARTENIIRFRCKRYSSMDDQWRETDSIIIDNIGMLSSIYRYAELAYIGGGFGAGIHNTLEPAAYAIPVLFGPHHKNFKEAVELQDHGGAFASASKKELASMLSRLLEDDDLRKEMGQKSRQYVQRNSGGAKVVSDKAIELL